MEWYDLLRCFAIALYAFCIPYDIWYSTGEGGNLQTAAVIGVSAYYSALWGFRKVSQDGKILLAAPRLTLVWNDLPALVGWWAAGASLYFYKEHGVLDMRTWTSFMSRCGFQT
jgi:hypothetical protein